MTRQASRNGMRGTSNDSTPLAHCLTAIQPYIPGRPASQRTLRNAQKVRNGSDRVAPSSLRRLADICERISDACSVDEAIQLAIDGVPALIGVTQTWVQLYGRDSASASTRSATSAPLEITEASNAQVTETVGSSTPPRHLRLVSKQVFRTQPQPLETPIKIGQQELGALRVLPERGAVPLSADERAALRLVAVTLGQTLARYELQAAVWGGGNDTSRRQLMEDTQRWNTFLAQVAHEVRTPLTCIKGHAQLLRKRLRDSRNPKTGKMSRAAGLALGEAVERHLMPLDYQVTRIERLIRDMIDLARSTQGTLDLHLERHDLVELVRQALNGLELRSSQEMVLDVPEEALLICDGARIDQALYDVAQHVLRSGVYGSHLVVTVRERRKGATSDILIGMSATSTECPPVPTDLCDIPEGAVAVDTQGQLSAFDFGVSLSAIIIQCHGGRLYQIVNTDSGGASSFIAVLPVDGTRQT